MAGEIKKSKLVPVGLMLLIGGCGGSQVTSRIVQFMRTQGELTPTGALLSFSTDLLITCGAAGLICLIIGGLRGRKSKKEAQKQSSNPGGIS
jgi:hypothetical protein